MDHLFFIVSWQALFKDEFLTNYLLKSFSVQCYAMLTIKFLFQIIYMKCIFNQIAAATMKSLHDVTVPQTLSRKYYGSSLIKIIREVLIFLFVYFVTFSGFLITWDTGTAYITVMEEEFLYLNLIR